MTTSRGRPKKPRNYEQMLEKFAAQKAKSAQTQSKVNQLRVNQRQGETAKNQSIRVGEKGANAQNLGKKVQKSNHIDDNVLENNEFSADHRQIQAIMVLIDPESWGLTLEQKAERAKMSTALMRKYLNDPAFQLSLKQVVSSRALETTPETLEAAIETAKIRGKGGHADRKMLLSMVGISTDHRTVGGSIDVKHDVTDRLERALSKKEAALAGLVTDSGPAFSNPEGDGGVIDLEPDEFTIEGPDDAE